MRKIITFKHYFINFLQKLSSQEKEKFLRSLNLLVTRDKILKKKTQKTPDSEIKKAIKLKEEYYAVKGNQQGYL